MPSHGRFRSLLPTWLASPAAAWTATAIYAAALGAVVSRHEMWRDEVQAWLFARDSSSPLALLHNMRYEGHPPLWHLLLWPIAQFSTDPVWMQVVHVAIATTTAFLVFRFAPFSWPIRILLVSGYFFSFEWAVLARNYALVAMFTIAFCVLYARRWTSLVGLGAVLGFLSLSHANGLLIALALGFTLTCEFIVSYVRKTGAEQHVAPFAAGVVLAALGMAAAVLQSMPPPDAGGGHSANLSWRYSSARSLAGAVVDGYLPVPFDKRNFWNTNRFLGQDSYKAPQPLRIPRERLLPAGLALLAFGALLLAGRPWMLVPFFLGTFAQLAFAHLFFFGHTRHHGMLFLMLVASLWMSFAPSPSASNDNRADESDAGTAAHSTGRIAGLWERHRMHAFAALLVLHVWGATIAIRTDWAETFSQAKDTARWLGQQFGDLDSVVFIGDRSPVASSVVGYLGLEQMYYPDRSAFGSYLIYDERRKERRTRSLADEVQSLTSTLGKDAVFVLSHPLKKEDGLDRKAQLVRRFSGAIAGDESYWIYFLRHAGPKS
jgi:hypothetical protein